MPEPIAQQTPESRLRRWWHGFFAAVEGMDISGYEHLAERIDDLEARVRRLEAARGPNNHATMPTHR